MKLRITGTLFALTMCLLGITSAPLLAQTCRWDGTGPFCNGECGNNETEVTRLDAIPSFWTPPFVNVNPPFGASCATGSKALCCNTPGRTCRWDGTAPFCDGSCRSGETQSEPPGGSNSGSSCWTGSKAYCCHVVTGFWNGAGGWNRDWFPLPGQAVFDRDKQHIAAVSRGPGNLDLFVIGFDNHVWTTFWNGAGGWDRDWFPLPGQAVFDRDKQHITAVSREPGNLDLFVLGFDNRAWSTFSRAK